MKVLCYTNKHGQKRYFVRIETYTGPWFCDESQAWEAKEFKKEFPYAREIDTTEVHHMTLKRFEKVIAESEVV